MGKRVRERVGGRGFKVPPRRRPTQLKSPGASPFSLFPLQKFIVTTSINILGFGRLPVYIYSCTVIVLEACQVTCLLLAVSV